MSKKIKFYEDKEKIIKVYPEIDPNGIEMGMTVGLADNLIAPTTSQKEDSFIFTSTGGQEDVADGYGDLVSLIGHTDSTTIEESYNYRILGSGVKAIAFNLNTFKTQYRSTGIYDFVYVPVLSYTSNLISSVNKTTFANKMSKSSGSYTFTYEAVFSGAKEYTDEKNIVTDFNKSKFAQAVNYKPGSYDFIYQNSEGWTLNDVSITLSQYGFTVGGNIENGATLSVHYISNAWYYGAELILLSHYGIITTGAEKPGDSITINYTGNEWQTNGEAVSLSTYGINITNGSGDINDRIQIAYQAEEQGIVQISYPTEIKSTGFNAFDINGNQIMEGFDIDAGSQSIVDSPNNHVVYFKCLGNQTYTIYTGDSSRVINRAAFSETEPATYSTDLQILSEVTQTSSGNTVSNTNSKKYFQTSKDGYMLISVNDLTNLCCHLTWSGYRDEDYEEYWSQSLPIPYRDENGNVISTYGLAYLTNSNGDDFYDEIDFTNSRYYKRVARAEYDATLLDNIRTQGVPYIYDSNYIYYGIGTLVYSLDDKLPTSIKVSDFGTIEIQNTTMPCKLKTSFQENLKDKLRRSVETKSNKTNDLSVDNKEEMYPNVQAVYELAQNFWQALGLAIDTYDSGVVYYKGDYVVWNHKIYKCTTDQTAVGTLNNIPNKYVDFTNSIVSSISNAFINSNFVKQGGIGEYILTNNSDGTFEIKDPNGNKVLCSSSTDAYSNYGITPGSATGSMTLEVQNTNGWIRSYILKA